MPSAPSPLSKLFGSWVPQARAADGNMKQTIRRALPRGEGREDSTELPRDAIGVRIPFPRLRCSGARTPSVGCRATSVSPAARETGGGEGWGGWGEQLAVSQRTLRLKASPTMPATGARVMYRFLKVARTPSTPFSSVT